MAHGPLEMSDCLHNESKTGSKVELRFKKRFRVKPEPSHVVGFGMHPVRTGLKDSGEERC